MHPVVVLLCLNSAKIISKLILNEYKITHMCNGHDHFSCRYYLYILDLSHSIVQLSWLNLCITAICVFVNKKIGISHCALCNRFYDRLFLEVLGVQTAWVFGA